jgi:hypothetical protein
VWNSSQATDPDNGGSSLVNAAELVLPCLEAVDARSLIEVGAGGGGLTRELLEWAAGRNGTVTAIDPSPGEALLELAEQNPALELVTQTSHDALPSLARADALVLDGDHNHYTLSRELELVANSAGDGPLPLLVLHDIGWPHARRDTYYAPERIPAEHRQPLAENASLDPAEPGIAPGGIPFKWAAAREGGANNGVLTAIEQFVAAHEQLDFAQIPLFWGVGVIWDRGAPGAAAVADVIAPWRDNPLLKRVEEHRVAHLVALCLTLRELSDLEGVNAHQQDLLRRMLDSSAFATGERLSRIKQRGHPMFSRDQIREALGELGEAEAEELARERSEPGSLRQTIPQSAAGEAS